MNHSWRRLSWIGGVACALVLSSLATGVIAADKERIKEAIDRGKKHLLSLPKTGAQGSLTCYALIKAGVDKDHVDIQRCVQEVLGKCHTDNYVPGTHHNYEAGVDAMLLEAVDRELYRPQLELIASFLVKRQRPHGAWYYNSEFANGGDFGDTSISQYAILGLWAAARAGVEVPIETWQGAARWLMQTQHQDGGFSYHPMENNPQSGVDSAGTMTAAGTGSLLIIRYVLFSEADYDEAVRPVAAPRRFGVLERLPEEKEKPAKAKPKTTAAPTISASAIDKALKGGVRWLGEHFADERSLVAYGNYYFYGIERVAALLDVEKLGAHNWYDEGADYLILKQAGTGSWTDSCGPEPATALSLLFLTKATTTAIHKPPKRAPLVGGGLLIGGRGLPDNLDAIQVKAGEVTKRKQHGPVDGLLAELEKSSDAKVEAVQEAVVEAVQLEHPEELINQVGRLKKLAEDKRVEVRRTAMWALGRTGNISVAPSLIRGISDSDESVVREASAGLCILSRRPNGCGLPPDPADGLKDGISDEESAAHLDRWKKTCTKQWTEWYLKVRPYEERDDRTVLKRKP